jgi:hypothetical protein
MVSGIDLAICKSRARERVEGAGTAETAHFFIFNALSSSNFSSEQRVAGHFNLGCGPNWLYCLGVLGCTVFERTGNGKVRGVN